MKHRKSSMDDFLNDQALPIPIQIFLWRQISPFIRPKLGKLHEATCMFCQHAPGHHETKEACKSFEKVLVQNIQFGLSPSLTEAIQSIPRWRLIQAALPHVMHASATFLHNRVKDLQSLGAVETKLLYTLHWIVLDAAEECAEADFEKGVFHSNPFYYLFSIPSLSLFIYLFAPIAQHLKESDFQNFRLENGLKIWQALWEFRRPETACFIAPCKPRPRALGRANVQRGPSDVFVGRKASRDEYANADSPPSQTVSVSFSDHQTVKPASIEEEVHVSQGWLSSPKDTVFPETIPEESSSTEEEHVVIFRLPAVHNNLSGLLHDPSIYTADASMLHHQPGGRITLGCVPPGHDTTKLPLSSKVTPQVQKMSSSDKDSVESCARSPHAAATSKGGDVLAATFLDVAVLRCLFVSQWQEEGVYWALHYIYNRLRDISDDVSNQSQPRKRSNSLPIPKIEVSIYQSPESKKRESLKNFMEVPELKDNSPNSEIPFYSGVVKVQEEPPNITRRASEKVKRRMKMADLKAFVETKLMSKSEKALEKIGQEDTKVVPYEQLEYHRSLDTGDADRPGSALGHNFPPLSPVAKHNKVMAMPSNLVKGKSMPSLSCLIDELTAGGYIGEIRTERRKPFELQYSHPPATQNPIITVTEHTPIPSPDYMKTRQGSLESQLDSVSMQGPHITPERKPSLTRSQTDSNITYVTDEIQEAPGSLCYITKDGDIDFLVVLKAVHFAAMRDNLCWTVRVMEVMLNLVEVLLDVGVLKAGRCHSRSHSDTPCKESSSGDFSTSKEFKTRETSLILGQSQDSPSVEKCEPRRDSSKSAESLTCPHYLILNVIMRVVQQLGCTQGCGSAARGPPAESLRVQARCLLGRARRASPGAAARLLRSAAAFKPLPRLMPFLHAYLTFCVDPSTLLSPMNQKRSNSKSPDVAHGGYATNFGAGLGSAGGHSAEGQVVECMFKILVTRLVNESKDLKIQEDIVLYRDIRQLMTYVKEAHGGVFRVVALSGLLDSADRPNKSDTNMQTTRVIRHIHHSEIEERESDTGIETSFVNDDRTNRKFMFKKRSTSSTCASLLETDACDDSSKTSQSPLGNLRKKHAHALTPRQSERTLCGMGESTTSNKSTSSKTKKLGGIVKWFRKPYGSSSSSYGDSDSPPGEAPPHLMRQASMMPLGGLGGGGRSRGGGGGSRAGKTLRSARRRVEDRLGRLGLRKMGKKRDGSLEESPGNYTSRRSSFELGESARESEVVVLKERRLVEIEPIYSGMLRFSFLLDTCQPGSIPDPHLMAALLDLPHTPVVSRACMLLECAHLVHSCNKGQWPQWMKVDMPNIRPSVPVPGRVSSHPGIRRLRAAGKMFYQWGEALCGRLEEMMQEDRQHVAQVVAMVTDPERQKELLQQDEEEDFLDEASVRLPGGPIGAECPIALRLIACMLLLEITAFLRETYQNLPKMSSRASVKERPPPWERIYRSLVHILSHKCYMLHVSLSLSPLFLIFYLSLQFLKHDDFKDSLFFYKYR